MQLELVMYSIRKLIENKTAAEFNATYGPKDSKCFGTQCGNDYHKFIVYTQRISNVKVHGVDTVLYLYYRNKRTQNSSTPVFSSCECGVFTGSMFVSLFKEHIEQDDGTVLTDAQFAQTVADKILNLLD